MPEKDQPRPPVTNMDMKAKHGVYHVGPLTLKLPSSPEELLKAFHELLKATGSSVPLPIQAMIAFVAMGLRFLDVKIDTALEEVVALRKELEGRGIVRPKQPQAKGQVKK